jgi:drug/metabolite transporter (DMT)-like permease
VSPARSASARNAYIGIACTLIGAIGFSGKTVIVKLAYRYGVDTMTLLALRMLFAAPFFLGMAWWAGPASGLTRRDWLSVLALGFLGYYLGSYLDLAGLQYITAGLGRLILYLYPTLVLAFSALFLRQRPGAREWLSLALSYLGIAIVFGTEIRHGTELRAVALGGLLVFLSAVTYASYLVAGSGLVRRLGSMRFTAYASLAATFFVLATFFSLHHAATLVVPRQVYGLTLVLAVFSTVLPLWFMAEGLKRIGASEAALVACIGPVSTIALAWMFLDEPVTLVQSAGAALVLAGVMIISVKPRAQPR